MMRFILNQRTHHCTAIQVDQLSVSTIKDCKESVAYFSVKVSLAAIVWLSLLGSQQSVANQCGPMPSDGRTYSCGEVTDYKWKSLYDLVPAEVRRNATSPLDYRYDRTNLGENAKSGKLKRVIKLVEKKKIPVDIRDNSGRTPLMYAAWKGHLDVVKYLVENGADLSAASLDGGTALRFAQSGKNREVVNYLELLTSPKSQSRLNLVSDEKEGIRIRLKNFVCLSQRKTGILLSSAFD